MASSFFMRKIRKGVDMMSKLNTEIRLFIGDNVVRSTIVFNGLLECRRRIVDGDIIDVIMLEIESAADTVRTSSTYMERWDSLPYTITTVFFYTNDQLSDAMMDEIADKLRTVPIIHEVRFNFRPYRPKIGGETNEM